MEISETKFMFLKKLGINPNDLPEEFNKKFESYDFALTHEERAFLFSDSYTEKFILPFKMKDIVGTEHINYSDKTIFEAFINSRRGDEIIKMFYSNPNYYSDTLRQPDQSPKTAKHDTPIELNRDSDGNCYIAGGNNRISLLMMIYLAELSNAKTEEEKESINNKYTFFAEIKSLPKNKEVYNIIFLLKDILQDNIKFSFKGNNPDDCHYEVVLYDEKIEINSIDEIKSLLHKTFDLSNLTSSEIIYNKLESLIYIYINNKNNKTKTKLLLEICPNIEIVKENFIMLRRINYSNAIFDWVDFTTINYSNINDVLTELIIKETNLTDQPSSPKM